MEESEFKAACHLTLHIKDKLPSPNIEGAKEILIKKGEAIPELFISGFIKNNPDYIVNLKIEDGLPKLTSEQEKKYGVSFVKKTPKTFSEEVEKHYPKYDLERLKQKLAKYIKQNGPKLGSEKFKNWAEKEFGEDAIDKRKSPDNIIVQILDLNSKELQ